MQSCDSCGNTEPESARFCGSCGSGLQRTVLSTVDEPEVQQALQAEEPTAATAVLDLDPEIGYAGATETIPDPTSALDATAELPVVDLPPRSRNEGPHAGARRGRERSRSRAAMIASAMTLLLAAAAAVAIIVLGNHSASRHANRPVRVNSQAVNYRHKLAATLDSVVRANQALTSALQRVDGSKRTLTAAQAATSQAQSVVAEARGALGTLTPPASETTLSQQAQQALTEETGYLQALASTLSSPTDQNASQLRPLLTATQSAMVPLEQVAPGASSSLDGLDNVLSWAAGASALAQNARQKSQQQQQQQQTAQPTPGSPAGMTACDQNISVGASTSCSFADNVFAQYAQDVQQAGAPGSYSVDAYSPSTGQTYTDNCNYNPTNQIVLCSHGSDLVQFPYWAAEVYQP